jgi:integrase/recombinase XerD
MSDLRHALENYLAIRRALGFELSDVEWRLNSFVSYMEQQGETTITTNLAVHWATLPKGGDPAYLAQRLASVRRFAAWRRATDPRTEVPPAQLLPYRYRRQHPYIYTDDEIQRLMRAASELSPTKGLRGDTYATVFGLLAITGLRISEVVALNRSDVDLERGILSIHRTKFGKSRMVPIHASTRDALTRYAGLRDELIPVTITQAFFISDTRRKRITDWSTRYNFARASRDAGLRAPVEGYRLGHGPRIHDMRHRFAVQTILNWYRTGLDVAREIPKLSTYLGHVHVNDTYWYFEAVPELLQLATDRLIKQEEMKP